MQTNYLSQVAYAPQGAPKLYQYGNNLWRQFSYNARLQLSGSADMVNDASGSTLQSTGYN